jgi:hypothetical protein
MRRAFAAVVIVVGTAHADPLSLDAPVAATLDRARVQIDAGHGRAVLAITLSSREVTPHVGSIAIRVPHGARAIGMTSAGVVARPMDSLDARAALSDVVAGRRDPAMLEQSWGEPDRLVLRAFPLAKGAAMTVEIAIELPAPATIAVAAPIQIDGPRVVALPRRAWMENDPAARSFVDARTSLYAEAPPPANPVVPTVVIGNPVTSCECEAGPTHRTIRKWIKLAIPRLRYCYERQLQLERTLEGEADLHFTIDPDGHTSNVTIDGTLDSAAVASCLAAEVATWEFAQGKGSTRVNYPLQFRPAR